MTRWTKPKPMLKHERELWRDAVLDAADGDEDIARIAKHLCRLRSMSGVARRQGLAWRARLSFWLRWVCGWVKMEVNDANDA